MTNDLFDAPPMGGEPAPYQELIPDQVVTQTAPPKTDNPEEKRARNTRMWLMGIGGLLVLVLVILVIVLAMVSQSKNPVVVIQPSPTPEPTAIVSETVLPQSLIDDVNQLETDLNTVDLSELDLSYPQLDWRIRY